MNTPRSGRRSVRLQKSVNYEESPVESPDNRRKSLRTPKAKNLEIEYKKTPLKHHHDEDSSNISPKKLRRNRTPSSKALESIVTESSPSMQKIDSSRRKSSRKSVKPEEDSLEVIEVDDSFNSTNADDKENENIAKPTSLFDEENDVEGKRLYSFKTPKKREGMAELANLTPKTPRHHVSESTTPKTPKHLRLSEIQKTPTSRPSAGKCTKTPRHVREEIKKSKSDYI